MKRNRAQLYLLSIFLLLTFPLLAQDGEFEPIDSDVCIDCHEESDHGIAYDAELESSIHEGFECQDCHEDHLTLPHQPDPDFQAGCQGCRDCHEDASDEYQAHGRAIRGSCTDMPKCADCHGDHAILPSSDPVSQVHPRNLPHTCGNCHEDLNLVSKYDILVEHPVEIYESSVHGHATEDGVYNAATCNDCHSSTGGHFILPPSNPASPINHFNIPKTCGKCHPEETSAYWEGIHGKMTSRGMANAPVCTDCHGEHGIIAPSDPRSPVSAHRVAAATCEPCHESTVLNERLGVAVSGKLKSYIDSYHGLKSEAGDVHVANCESCHGAHRILPSTDPKSTIAPANLKNTCSQCHPGITEQVASIKIHSFSQEETRSPIAVWVEKIYIVLLILVIGGMFLHTLLDYLRSVRNSLSEPTIRRMTGLEVFKHLLLLISFFVLVISGFSLRFGESWLARAFFGWEGGFELRGTIHRFAAVGLIVVSLWHLLFLFTPRGHQLLRDMFPGLIDFKHFGQMLAYFFGRRSTEPRFMRFAYMEKLEYWAGVWGNIVMIATGLILWFDNWFSQFFSNTWHEVALVIHYWEAWLATLAILIWHLYNTVFRPAARPMNPSWLTGRMPRSMFEHEHGAVEPDSDIN